MKRSVSFHALSVDLSRCGQTINLQKTFNESPDSSPRYLPNAASSINSSYLQENYPVLQVQGGPKANSTVFLNKTLQKKVEQKKRDEERGGAAATKARKKGTTTRMAGAKIASSTSPAHGGHGSLNRKTRGDNWEATVDLDNFTREELLRTGGRAFPLGTQEFPYRSKRVGGGSVNAITQSRARFTKTPMGLAGVIEMYQNARPSHASGYSADRFGQRNFTKDNPNIEEMDIKAVDVDDGGGGGGGTASVFEQIETPRVDDLDRYVAIDCRNARYPV